MSLNYLLHTRMPFRASLNGLAGMTTALKGPVAVLLWQAIPCHMCQLTMASPVKPPIGIKAGSVLRGRRPAARTWPAVAHCRRLTGSASPPAPRSVGRPPLRDACEGQWGSPLPSLLSGTHVCGPVDPLLSLGRICAGQWKPPLLSDAYVWASRTPPPSKGRR